MSKVLVIRQFRIKDPTTGLFSSGGRRPHWTHSGKVWTSQGNLKRHVAQSDHILSFYREHKALVVIDEFAHVSCIQQRV